MQRTIRNRLYDTDAAQLIHRYTSGFYGDENGYEERLYLTPDGHYFLYGVGGPASPYPNETIRCMSQNTAEKWQASHNE